MKSVNYINDSSFISKESYEKRQMFRNSCEIAGKHKSQEIKKVCRNSYKCSLINECAWGRKIYLADYDFLEKSTKMKNGLCS